MRHKWKKILYEDQHVPDNYVDESFLEELRKNLYTRNYQFWMVVEESGVVTQQISSICLFVVAFIYMEQGRMSPQFLFALTAALTMIGYFLNDVVDRNTVLGRLKRTWWDDVKTITIFLGFGFGLAPILMTLTDTISTDTVYAMTAFMLLANLVFHDYGANAAMVSGSLSLNAAIFASVCLASRLPTTWHAFATVTFAVEIFALWPVLRRKVKKYMRHSDILLTVMLGFISAAAIYTVSTVGAILYSVVHIFITFICPAWLISLQQYKDNIHGPWEEAVITEEELPSVQDTQDEQHLLAPSPS